MTRARLAVLAAAAGLLGACYEYTGPRPAANLFLSGSWAFSNAGTPAGGGDSIGLQAAGGVITGTGVEYRLCCFYDSFKINGQYSDSAQSFALAIQYSQGPTVTYVGKAWGVDSLVGVWTDSEYTPVSPRQKVFHRMSVPPCADSAPLIGTYNPAAPGFIVRFQDSVNASVEATLLAGRYGFMVSAVYQASMSGFAANFSPATVAVLRCEPKVTSVSYDGTVTMAGPTLRR